MVLGYVLNSFNCSHSKEIIQAVDRFNNGSCRKDGNGRFDYREKVRSKRSEYLSSMFITCWKNGPSAVYIT